MTNKLVVIKSLKVPKIKKILLYEMKFIVPNYSCLQNPWLGGYRHQIPVLSVLCPQLNLLNPPGTKFLGTPLEPTSPFCVSFYVGHYVRIGIETAGSQLVNSCDLRCSSTQNRHILGDQSSGINVLVERCLPLCKAAHKFPPAISALVLLSQP